MRTAGWATLVVALTQALPAHATEAPEVLGLWEQVATNAGACPSCRIAFRPEGSGLTVIANNGWAAALSGTAGGDIVGAGRWEDGRRAWVSGKPFTIRFHLEGGRLAMTMTVDTGAEPKPIVRATYKRAWQGV